MRVYLSKSNRANPNLVSKVRKALKNSGHEVVEYNGGSFSTKPLLSCEHLFVVPDKVERPKYLLCANFGKGVDGQISTFVENSESDTYDNITIIHNDFTNTICSSLKSVYYKDVNNFLDYSEGELYETCKFSKFMSDFNFNNVKSTKVKIGHTHNRGGVNYSVKSQNNVSSDELMLLLIKK